MSSVKWKRDIVKQIVLDIVDVINSDEELKRLNEVANYIGIIDEIDTMLQDKRWWIVAGGILKAGRMQQKKFIPIIKECMYADKFDLVHLSAKALCQMGESTHVVDYLIKNEQHLSKKVIVNLGDMLSHKTTDDKQVKCIVENFNNVSPKLQSLFIEVLGKRKVASQLPLITSLLNDENKELRLKALRSIGNIGITLVDESVFKLLSSDDWQERVLAIFVIRNCKLERAIPILVEESLQDMNWWVRVRSAQALASFGELGHKKLEWASQFHEDAYARDIAKKTLQEISMIPG
ncbi:HEAT repeat domain-containing protein [Bacillus solimangrovi]|nr:HEAT repeat domain-containing protein [Bacillus solimangrovi]